MRIKSAIKCSCARYHTKELHDTKAENMLLRTMMMLRWSDTHQSDLSIRCGESHHLPRREWRLAGAHCRNSGLVFHRTRRENVICKTAGGTEAILMGDFADKLPASDDSFSGVVVYFTPAEMPCFKVIKPAAIRLQVFAGFSLTFSRRLKVFASVCFLLLPN